MGSFKAKMIELEGIIHDFRVYEKQVIIDNNKKEKQQDLKEKEVELQINDVDSKFEGQNKAA